MLISTPASYILGHKCEEGKPHCFVSVSHFHDWITKNSGASLVTESSTEDTTIEHTESDSTVSETQTHSDRSEDNDELESSTEHDATETTSCLSEEGGEESGKSKKLGSVMAFLDKFTEKVMKMAGKPSLNE